MVLAFIYRKDFYHETFSPNRIISTTRLFILSNKSSIFVCIKTHRFL